MGTHRHTLMESFPRKVEFVKLAKWVFTSYGFGMGCLTSSYRLVHGHRSQGSSYDGVWKLECRRDETCPHSLPNQLPKNRLHTDDLSVFVKLYCSKRAHRTGLIIDDVLFWSAKIISVQLVFCRQVTVPDNTAACACPSHILQTSHSFA